MNASIASVAALLLTCGLCQGTDKVFVFGDSLSKEYEVEFANIDASNWAELLDDHRHDQFDLGSFRVYSDFRITGHKYNWSVPGATSADQLDNLTSGNFFDEIAQDEIKDQLRDEVNRVVIFLGGNDVENNYRRLYNGEENEQITNRIFNNVKSILSWVKSKSRRPDLPIVLVNVPHVGATPKVKQEFPTDPVKTGRVTESLRQLNDQLAALAFEQNVGYADVFTLTLALLEDEPYCVSGVRFLNEPNANAGKFYLWLGGSLADEFHPNTVGQAAIANAIIAGFNTKYGSTIASLGGTEILDILGINRDLSYQTWITCYEAGSQSGPNDDLDGDGLDNLTEFAFDMDPRKPDLWPIQTSDTSETTNTLVYRPRLRQSANFSVTLEESTDLQTWTSSSANRIIEQPYGWFQWQAPEGDAITFVRFNTKVE